MPRKNRQQNIDSGFLTAQLAAEFLGISKPTVIKKADSGEIDSIKINGRERKFSAEAVYIYANRIHMPIHRDLLEALKNYCVNFPDSLEISEEEKQELFPVEG